MGASKRRQVDTLSYIHCVIKQKDLCAVCGRMNVRNRPLNAAFDMKRNFLGALVCNFCLRGLYGFQYNPELLQKAIDFMEKYGRQSV